MQPVTVSHASLSSHKSLTDQARKLFPGVQLAVLLAILASLAANWLSNLTTDLGPIPVSPIVIAILLGITIRNTLGFGETFQAGLQFSQCKILQAGVVLLGIRLSLSDIAVIGFSSIPLIVACIGTALITISFLGRRAGLSPQLATLIAAGTSICGATAIVTTAPIISARNHEVSYAIACITLFGIAATLFYPLAANWLFDGNAQQVGLFLGTAVHDTAQVVGAGMIYQNLFGTEQALDTATITKLLRNLSMLIVIPALSITFQRRHHTGGARPHWSKLVPLFIVGFALMSMVRTVGDLGTTPFGILSIEQWEAIIAASKQTAEICLLIAMAAVGLNTSFAGLRSIGFKPLALGLVAAALVGLVSSTLISIFY
jgi:uncharacterized integral membrane protein (TIGR00698 family)